MNETVVYRNELGGYSTPYDKNTLARLYYELQKENDKLRARLAKAVELKANVGDTLYMPWVYDGTYDIAKLEIIGIAFRKSEFVYITDLQSDNAYYLEKYKLGIFRNEDFDNMVFTDYDKAEGKLKEYNNGK